MKEKLAVLFLAAAFVIGGALPASAEVLARDCDTYPIGSTGGYQLKICTSVNQHEFWQYQYSGLVQFCLDNSGAWICGANRMEVDYLRLRVDKCGDGQGWYTARSKNDLAFNIGPGVKESVATDWWSVGVDGPDEANYLQTVIRFRVRWDNGGWSPFWVHDSYVYKDPANGGADC